jgi:RNA polymerase sigma-70 factor, ECF subfamily
VMRWIARTLNSPMFWSLRNDWLDLLQEVLARILQSLRVGRFDSSRDFRAYVQGIARHTAMQALTGKIQARAAESSATLHAPRASDPESQASRRQMVRWVLDAASDDCRGLIRAYFFEDRSYAEIATSMGIPLGTVKSRLFRCLEAAHRAVQGSGGSGNPKAPGTKRRRTEGPA